MCAQGINQFGAIKVDDRGDLEEGVITRFHAYPFQPQKTSKFMTSLGSNRCSLETLLTAQDSFVTRISQLFHLM